MDPEVREDGEELGVKKRGNNNQVILYENRISF